MIGFIVEGQMEEKIIREMCKGSEVRRLQINGSKFPVEKIAERVCPHISLLRRKGVKKFILIIDREQRDVSSEEFEKDILNKLSDLKIDISSVIVASPDRNFESWFVPFLNSSCKISTDVQSNAEGCNGKSIAREKFKASGQKYVEVVDGVSLFKKVTARKLSEASFSFKRFFDAFDEECWWMKKD
ncbi:hypothetical protein [Rhizobium paknamense]|uniref:DUF4276 family protein n=1 Tax=Rhizobium paknamense TaxID=1206817 RepID=A0ABU0ICX9_9HYPH|nr:hypothetical protein [Rhizobium paknamense]MDQ0456105.1 hypothetical protein [Rhizobium paknamense]